VTRRGTFIGNYAGVLGMLVSVSLQVSMFSDKSRPSLALVYNAINSSIDHWRGRHDIIGSMTAGGITGAIYKSTG
jgi:mitochondrial import inner membrane translocase subunit TIM23